MSQKTGNESLLLPRAITPFEKIEEAHQHMSMPEYPPVHMED